MKKAKKERDQLEKSLSESQNQVATLTESTKELEQKIQQLTFSLDSNTKELEQERHHRAEIQKKYSDLRYPQYPSYHKLIFIFRSHNRNSTTEASISIRQELEDLKLKLDQRYGKSLETLPFFELDKLEESLLSAIKKVSREKVILAFLFEFFILLHSNNVLCHILNHNRRLYNN